MRNFASCFSEQAVKVSDSSCSGSSSSGSSSSVVNPSVQSSITSLYRGRLSTCKDLLIKVTWFKSHIGPALSVGVDDNPPHHNWKLDAVNSQLLRKKKGTRSYVSGNSVVGLYWDISAAKYGHGPEPVDDFYLVVIVDAEFGLLLGNLSKEFIKRFEEETIPIAEFSLVSRREQVLGHTLYSTKARFSDGGRDHEIMIRCKGGGWDAKDSEISVSIDRKRVVQVRRLQWNFRGNQTVFVDGSPVDLMWDTHDWWFSSPPGYAVFMFRKRSSLENRLWLEEEMLHKEMGISGFSLLIQAFKSP